MAHASGGLRTSLPREHRHVLVCWNSLDDMAEREMAKLRSKKPRNEPSSSSSQKKDQFRPSQKEFDDLVKAMPDPANVQDSLLADDGGCFFVFFKILLLLVVITSTNSQS